MDVSVPVVKRDSGEGWGQARDLVQRRQQQLYVDARVGGRQRDAQPRRAFGHGGRADGGHPQADRKSTRLNSSHTVISYAVFCLKKKKKKSKDVGLKATKKVVHA